MKRKLLIYAMAAGVVLSTVSYTMTAFAEGTSAAVISNTSQKQEIGPGVSREEKQMQELLVWGQVIRVDKEYNRIYLNNSSPNFPEGELVLSISEDHTRVLEAVDGLPATLDEIGEGQIIYAYIAPVMTLSLPPITTPSMILCKIPADFRVPQYVEVESMAQQEDGSYKLTAADGTEYAVPADCNIQPYLTRNMVYLNHVTEGNKCLLWIGEGEQVRKIVLFAD